jgi:membrane peptidoglycan carboxypeptidase
VAAAAHAYFGTTPDKLTVPQAALLAGMVNNPNLYNPYTHPQQAATRRDTVLDAMVATGSITAAAAAKAKAAPLGVVARWSAAPGSTCIAAAPDAGFFCDYAVRYLEQAGFTEDQLDTGGYTIKTTMDPSSARHRRTPSTGTSRPRRTASRTRSPWSRRASRGHDVLAMVANRNFGTDAAKGDRSTNIVADPSNVFGAGSSFKIFTTAAALEQGTVGFDSDLPNPGSGLLHAAEQQPLHALLPGLQRRRLRRPDLPPGRARHLAQRGVRRPGSSHRHARGGADGAAAGVAPDPRVQRRGQ